MVMVKEEKIISGSDSEQPEVDEATDIEAGKSEAAPAAEPGPAVDPTTSSPAPAPAAPHPPSDVPNGGWEAWLQVVGSWVVLVDTWGLINTFGVFQAYYETNLPASNSSSDISWIGSVQGCLLMFVGVVSGPLYDAGFFRHLLMSGLFLIVFGQFMTSLCTTYWQVFLAQGVCVGVGMGLAFLPSTVVLAQYFSGGRRALAIGIANTGSPVAGIVFPIVFGQLQPRVGFGWATRTIAFLLLAVSIVPVVFMHTRRTPPGTSKPPARRARAIVDRTAFTDPPFVVFCLASFFSFLTLYVPFFYIQVFATAHGMASAAGFAPYLVTLLNTGSVFGRVVPNWLAGRLGGLRVMIGCVAVSAVLACGWLGITDTLSLGGLIAFALLYGAFSGGVVSLTPSVVIEMTPDMAKVGARMGVVFLFCGLSILTGTPIAGAILGERPDRAHWLGTIGYGAAGLSISAALYMVSAVLLRRRAARKQ